MKRYIRAATQYTERTTIQHGSQRFSVHYTPDEYSGMVQAAIQEIHPYDDAEYAWAKIIGPQAIFYQDGKVVDKMSISPFEEDDYEGHGEGYTEYDQYINEVFDTVAVELMHINRNVKPVMVHN